MGTGQGSARPIIRLLDSMCGYFRARPAPPSRRARPALERLEGRSVPAALDLGWEAVSVTQAGYAPWLGAQGWEATQTAEPSWPEAPDGEGGGAEPVYPAGWGEEPPPGPLGQPAPEPAPAGQLDGGADPRGAGPVAMMAASRATPVVTPALVPVRDALGLGGLPVPAAVPFRLARSPVGEAPLEIRYNLTGFNGGGVVGRDRVVTLAPGAGHVDVPSEVPPGGHEVVTLTLLEGDYRITRPSVCLFLGGDARGCSDLALVGAYQRGRSAEAFAALVERNRPAVLRTCYRVLGNWHDAEDVTQLVFLTLGTRALRLQSTLAGWLRTVAHNASVAMLRSRGRRARHERVVARPLGAPADPVPELREEIEAALRRVAPPLRDAVRLRYLEGWSQKEAADRLGCPRGTLSQRAAAGLSLLRDALRGENS